MPLSPAEEARLYSELLEMSAAEREQRFAALALDPAALDRLRRLFAVPSGWDAEIQSAIAQEAGLWSGSPRRCAGEDLDRFTIEERLGRGGSGEVYRVTFTQAGVRRQGALKLLHPGLLRSSQVALWDRERRLAARLSHPFIATLLDSGTLSTGEPFLLMEFVEGSRIDEYCRALPLRDRVRTVLRVCEAVAAAHRQLVIHRDLKPSNILITADGLPKLVDFGIAQALESGSRLIPAATRSYSSPEQLAGSDPTPASDVFSLGKVIGATLTTPIPAELSSLISKACHPDPSQRYATADALRDDLANWLHRRPVQAHSVSRAYRLRCFLLRNRWPVAASTLLLLAATTAGAVARRQYLEATHRFNELRSLARVAIFDIDTAIRDLPGTLPARKVLTDTALGYLASLEAAARNDLSLRAELADAYQRVAILQASSTSSNLNRLDSSLDLMKQSLALRDELGQASSRDPILRRDYAALLSRLTGLSRSRMRGEDSRIYLERLRAFVNRWRSDEPRSREALEAAIYASDETARQLYMQSPQQAYAHQSQSVAQIEQLLDFGPPDSRYWKVLSDSYRLLGSIASGCGLVAEARAHLLRAIGAADQWRSAEPTVSSVRTALLSYNDFLFTFIHRASTDFAELERFYQSTASILDSPFLPDPKSPVWRQHRAERLCLRGLLDAAQGRAADARRSFGFANQILDEVLKEGTGSFWAAITRSRISTALAKLDSSPAQINLTPPANSPTR